MTLFVKQLYEGNIYLLLFLLILLVMKTAHPLSESILAPSPGARHKVSYRWWRRSCPQGAYSLGPEPRLRQTLERGSWKTRWEPSRRERGLGNVWHSWVEKPASVELGRRTEESCSVPWAGPPGAAGLWPIIWFCFSQSCSGLWRVDGQGRWFEVQKAPHPLPSWPVWPGWCLLWERRGLGAQGRGSGSSPVCPMCPQSTEGDPRAPSPSCFLPAPPPAFLTVTGPTGRQEGKTLQSRSGMKRLLCQGQALSCFLRSLARAAFHWHPWCLSCSTLKCWYGSL